MNQHDMTTVKSTVGMVTTGTGIATYMSWIESALGIVATLLGIGLTSWLIYKEIRAERERRAAIRGDIDRRRSSGRSE